MFLQGETIKRDNAIVMIPRSSTQEIEGTDGPEDPLPLDLDNMLKAIPKGGSQRQKIKKNRDWKSSVAVYNDL